MCVYFGYDFGCMNYSISMIGLISMCYFVEIFVYLGGIFVVDLVVFLFVWFLVVCGVFEICYV